MAVATRTKVPRAKLMPTLPIGQPMPVQQPQMRIPEPATLIGNMTGRPLLQVGDNPNGPEMLHVTPPPGPVGGNGRAKLPVSMATGGSALVGYDPLQNQYAKQQQVYDSRQAGINTATQSLGAQAGVYNAVNGTFGPQQNQINAERAVLPAQAAVTQAQRGYIGDQQTANNQRIAEEVGIQNAQANTPDQIAIARGQQYRNSMDYKYALGGVAAPVEIATASGADTAGLGAGVRAKLQTQAELLTTKSNNAETLRKLNLASTALGVDLLNLNVDDLQRVARSAGLDVQQAQQAVDQARNAAGIAGLGEKAASLNTDRASLDLERAKNIDPSQVVYQSPDGRASLMSPGDARLAKANADRQFAQTDPGAGSVLYTDPYTGTRTYMTQDQANQKKAQYERDFKITNAGADQESQNQTNAATAGQRYSNTQYGGISTPEIVQGVVDGSFNENEAVHELTVRGLSLLQAYQLIVTAKTRTSGTTQITGIPGLNGGQ